MDSVCKIELGICRIPSREWCISSHVLGNLVRTGDGDGNDDSDDNNEDGNRDDAGEGDEGSEKHPPEGKVLVRLRHVYQQDPELYLEFARCVILHRGVLESCSCISVWFSYHIYIPFILPPPYVSTKSGDVGVSVRGKSISFPHVAYQE